MGPTFASVGVAHIVGGTVRVIVWVGSGSIYSNELAPVYLQNTGRTRSISGKMSIMADITELLDRRKKICINVA